MRETVVLWREGRHQANVVNHQGNMTTLVPQQSAHARNTAVLLSIPFCRTLLIEATAVAHSLAADPC